jgi:hypothetical protein
LLTVRSTPILDLSRLDEGWETVDISVDSNGDPVLLRWRRPDPLGELPPEGPERLNQLARERREAEWQSYLLLHAQDGAVRSIELPRTRTIYSRVRCAPPQTYWLSRVQREQERSVVDAYRANGTQVRSLDLGHGISALEITDAGRIWVGYADNGANPDGRIACYDVDGQQLLRFNQLASKHALGEVFDCYGLNLVANDEVWAWYLDDQFWLIKFSELTVAEQWSNVPRFSSFQFAVSGNAIAFPGLDPRHYPELENRRNLNRCRFCRYDLATSDMDELFPVTDAGVPLTWTSIFSRGAHIYFESGGQLYRTNPFDVDSIAETDQVPTVELFRPVGPNELALIRAANFRAFPPRLPEQPIFYPVLNETYAAEIASTWNVKASGAGFVTRFRVRESFTSRYPVERVGSSRHDELWIPAEDLDELNANIVGEIEVIAEFH